MWSEAIQEFVAAVPAWFVNLVAWSLQAAALVAVAALFMRLLRIRQPRVLLVQWQVLFAVSLLLPFLQPWHRPPAATVTTAASVAIAGALPASSPPSTLLDHLPLTLIAEILGVVILAGIFVRLSLVGVGLLRLRRLRHASWAVPEDAPSAGILGEMRVLVDADAEFRLSAGVDSPVMFGLAAPVVLLPERFPSLDPRFQAAIACHELAHVRRHDWAYLMGEEILGACFWFHPGLAWLIGRIRLAREQVVDAEVVRLTGSRKAYLESLLESAAGTRRTATMPAPPFLAERQLTERVALMLKEVRMSKTKLISSLAVVACSVALTGVLAARAFPLQAVGAKQETGPKPIQVGGQAEAARIMRRVAPVYPPEAIKAGVQGSVVFKAVIAKDGTVKELTYVSGPPILAKSAEAAIRQWRYKPTLVRGTPVEVITVITAVFTLGESRKAAFQFPAEPRVFRVVPPTGEPKRIFIAAPAKPAGPQVIPVGGDTMAARIVHMVRPVYPEVAQKAHIQGTVVFHALIGKDGTVQQLTYVSGPPLLVEAAKKAIEQWRYKPEMLNGKPVEVETTISVVFTLGGK